MPCISTRWILAIGLAVALCETRVTAENAKPTAEQTQFFESKIRPLLIDQCTKCHGAEKQKAGLRLDSRAGMLSGGETGPAVVPGKPAESLLVTAIRHEEDGPKMPPSKKLPAPAIADLTRWVEMGAPWPGPSPNEANPVASKPRGEYQISPKDKAHWAFQPIRKPTAPKVKKAEWIKNPIDGFILAGLEAKGFTPNPAATKAELIRRATYDLTGLPPSPDEVKTFLADPSPRAYEALIDRLLASPHYGEKWGRHWLDLVRYAETNSYERDGVKPNAWRYRDYVIRAFNADKPFDRFVREQLAGDELADATNDSLIATGYYRLGIWDDEPSDRDLARYDSLDDLVATTGQVFLGLTIDCARCHDHKLDPIPQKDYYRLVSFFQNTNTYRNGGPTDEVPLFVNDKSRQAYDLQVRETEKKLNPIRDEIAAIESEFAAKSDKARSDTRIDLEELRYRFYRDTWKSLPDFDALKPESTGSLSRPLFDLSPRTRDDAFGFVFEGSLVVPTAGRYTFFLDSDDGSRLKIHGKTVIENDGVHDVGSEKTVALDLPQGRVPIRLDYFQGVGGFQLKAAWSGPGFARRSLAVTEQDKVLAKARTGADRRRSLLKDGAKILGAEKFARYQQLKVVLNVARKEIFGPERALCVTEAGPQAPDTFVLLRGNPQTKGDKVEPAFLQVLGANVPNIPKPAPNAKSSGRRLALANWIVSADNPLTPRVLANRIWQHHFGRGIVRSSSNFGLQGDKPTHPELLDWLATELVSNGWHLKSLHRLIMTSNAYQMSSLPQEKALASDPINDRFWRFDMRRLSAEEIRDSILAVTGTLNTKMYGPGVYPTIPPEVLAGQSVPGSGWGKSSPEDEARRSIYIHVKRSLLTPILESFDAAETDRSSPNRFATTQPTQALAMINGTFLNLEAESLAKRLRTEAGADRRKQVELALKLVTSRPPNEQEIRRALGLIEALESQGANADAALKSFCLVALNLNEFLYID